MSIEENLHEYWDIFAKNYSKRVGYELTVYQKDTWLETLGEIADTNQVLDVLDVGTGPGFLTLLFAELGHRSVGVDFSQEMLTLAEKNAAEQNLECKFVCSDAMKLPFEDNSFDMVINRHLLWALVDPAKAVMEWKRVLKPGGKLVIMDGAWDTDDQTIVDKARKALGNLLIMLRRRSFKARTNERFRALYKHLPYRGADDEKIGQLMKISGLGMIRTHDISRLILADLCGRSFGHRLIYNYKRYIVIGEK